MYRPCDGLHNNSDHQINIHYVNKYQHGVQIMWKRFSYRIKLKQTLQVRP
jgi:hypothetical protein